MTTSPPQGRALAGDGADASGAANLSDVRPLAGYMVMTASFALALGGAVAASRRKRGELPARYEPWDLLTVGVATHKLSRLISKDRVTSFIRAPFARYRPAEGREEPRGSGVRRAAGELLTCPYCVGQWVAAGFAVGLVGAPELTRLVAFIYSAETISDFLQLAYRAADDAT